MRTNGLKLFAIALILALVAVVSPGLGRPAAALSSDIVISQIYGGGGNAGATYTHDFVELFNRGTVAVDVTGWSVQYASATGGGFFGATTTQITPLTGTIQPGQYFLVLEASAGANGVAPPATDVTDASPIAIGGSAGKVALVTDSTSLGCNGSAGQPCNASQLARIKDLVGFGATAASPPNFFEGAGPAPEPNPSATNGVQRLGGGCTETDNNNTDFVEATPAPRNTSSTLNVCGGGDTAPSVTGTTPTDNATNVAVDAAVTITFSEAVNVSGTIQVVGTVSGTQNVTPTTSDNLTFTLDPADFTASETVTVTVDDAQVTDQDGDDPPNNLAADFVFDFTIAVPVAACGDPATPIHDIQSIGAASPMAGNSGVTIEGVVVGDFQDTTAEPPNELNGYFVQEEDAAVDADPNTSEGIFVFEGANPTSPPVINVGDTVRVTGTVIEFGDVAGGTLTELTTLTSVQVCAGPSGAVSSATINLPVSSLDDYEKFENMAVNFPQELTVTEVFTLGRFGEVLLAADGRLWVPTHEAEPGAPAAAVEAANILRSITLDDGLTNQNPDPVIYPAPGLSALNTLRGGDTTTGLTGVMHFLDTTEDYRVQPTGTVTWNHENPRPADAPAVPGSLKVVGSNTLNYFITIDPDSNDNDNFTADNVCGPNYDGNTANGMECRGADSANEFTRQHDKLINMLVELDADIVGLNELENNAAASPANDDNDPVLESIVDALNAQLGAGTYDFIDTGAIGGDAIKVGMIYKPASVTPIGSFNVLTSAYDPDFIDTRNRPVLAQTFEDNNGGVFTVAAAHLKSKGSDCGGAPDDQPDSGGGNCNGTRTRAAEVMVAWFAEPTVNNGDPDILLVGDLNSYAKEDPIDVFVNAGYVDLAATLTNPYSYVFDGEWGYLDYGMASPTLYPQVAGVAEWHINADEPIALDYNTEFKSAGQVTSFYDDAPFRVSDHDPILVGLNLNAPDTTPPNTTITNQPTNPSASNGAFFQYNSSEGGNQFECQLDGVGWTDCDGNQVTYGGLTDGSHTFEVRAIDAANNTDPTPASYTWVIDTTAPTVTINQAAGQADPTSSSPDVYKRQRLYRDGQQQH